ncbi:hypothetical protein E1180_19390 [Roseibium denhamense]|uniref:Uncharacterized protein n=1 Tax=Roseibium denhamense TaxID=76305 RepID=A0ABY1P1U4_9HYPH|nr:hypothetical protein [Roseibium denhamense]MTI07670.1 hypothetical protein [Roseibium denhamense]SMP24406.1 hypothetical protein SAMN06265374_2438 [Roseibium denhamense]
MMKTKSWTPIPELDEKTIRPDLARSLLINTLVQNKGSLQLNGLQNSMPGKISSKGLAQTVRDAALDGLVRVDKTGLTLTSLGRKVAENS